MKHLTLVAAIALAAGAVAPAFAAATDVKQFPLTAQNDSGQHGTATLLGRPDGTTIVKVRITNPGDAPQPAHIHKGPCSKLDPKPTYALAPLVNGVSQTTVNAPMSSLVGHGFAINVHKSAADASVYTSCGDLN